LIIGSGQSGVKNDDGKSEERKGRNESDFEHEVAEAREREFYIRQQRKRRKDSEHAER